MAGYRNQLLPADLGTFMRAEHRRNRGPVYIGIEQANVAAHLRQSGRNVGRDGRLADPAFSGSEQDDVPRPGNEILTTGRVRARPLNVARPRDIDFELVVGGRQPLGNLLRQMRLRRPAWRGERHRQSNFVPLDGDVFDESRFHEPQLELGVDDLVEDRVDGIHGDRWLLASEHTFIDPPVGHFVVGNLPSPSQAIS